MLISNEGNIGICCESQDWYEEPEKIEILVTDAFELMVKRLVDAFAELAVDYISKVGAVEFEMFDGDGRDYFQDGNETRMRVERWEVLFYRSGSVSMRVWDKHTNTYIWVDICNYRDGVINYAN